MRGVTNNAYQERANAGIKSTVLRSTGFDPPDQLPARAGGDRPGKCQPGLSPGKGSSGENSNGRAEGGAGGGGGALWAVSGADSLVQLSQGALPLLPAILPAGSRGAALPPRGGGGGLWHASAQPMGQRSIPEGKGTGRAVARNPGRPGGRGRPNPRRRRHRRLGGMDAGILPPRLLFGIPKRAVLPGAGVFGPGAAGDDGAGDPDGVRPGNHPAPVPAGAAPGAPNAPSEGPVSGTVHRRRGAQAPGADGFPHRAAPPCRRNAGRKAENVPGVGG